MARPAATVDNISTRRIRLAVIGGLAAWAVTAIWIVPAITGAFGGGNGPVDARLAHWKALAWQVSFWLSVILILLWITLPLLRLRRQSLGTAAGPRPESPALTELLWLAAWCGMVFGLAESHYLAWKSALHEVVPAFRHVSLESLWITPILDTLVLVALGLVVWGLARRVKPSRSLQWTVFLLAGVGLTGLFLVSQRLSHLGAILLSLGIAWHLGRLAARHQDRFLRMARRTVPVMAGLIILAFLAARTPSVVEYLATERLGPPPGETQNLVLIVLDTERARNLSLYGHQRPTTPNLERLAARGAIFDWAISSAPWTLPSHGSIFTGRYPSELGTSYDSPLSDSIPTLATVLRSRGYMTAGFVSNFYFLTPLYGLDHGFIHWDAQPLSWQMAMESPWILRTALRWIYQMGDRTGVRKDAATVTDEFLAWRAKQTAGRPYFAFLNYFDAHSPYLSPGPYATRFRPAEHERPRIKGDEASLYAARELEELEEAYDGAISYIDEQLGRLVTELEGTGDLARTLVIITSDHGEEFGEHGFVGHGRNVNLPVIHVPLVVLHPSVPAGTRVDLPVSLIGLPATAMDLLGIRDHPFEGRSLSRYWAPDSVPQHPEPIFSEEGFYRSMLLGEWHLIRGAGGALYNVAIDPTEQVDLKMTADSAFVEGLWGIHRAFGEQHPVVRRPRRP